MCYFQILQPVLKTPALFKEINPQAAISFYRITAMFYEDK
jgi:hypothetical protein